MPIFNSGPIPVNDAGISYEEFETVLASFALSLSPLSTTKIYDDLVDYNQAMHILRQFSYRYGIQTPELAIAHPRTDNIRPQVLSNSDLIERLSVFPQDTDPSQIPKKAIQKLPIDIIERNSLGRLILTVFERYDIATIGYDTTLGKKVPKTIEKWDKEKQYRTLIEIVLAE